MNSKLKLLWNNSKSSVVIITVFIAGLSAFLTNTQFIIDFFKPKKEKGIKVVDADFHNSEETKEKQITNDTVIEKSQSHKIVVFNTSSKVRINGNTIDIKLRNTGDEISVLKKIIINIKKKWVITPTEVYYSLLESSATYELLIDCTKNAPFVLTKNISHEIEPNKSDRFLLNFGAVQNNLDESYIYLADITLLYNENNSQKMEHDFIFGFLTGESKYKYPDKRIMNISDTFTGFNKELFDKVKSSYLNNRSQINEIRKANAVKSKEVTEFVEMILNK